MKIENGLLKCVSRDPYYSKEKIGIKPNTLKIVGEFEVVALLNGLHTNEFNKIQVQLKDKEETFIRFISDISIVGELLGKTIIIISWHWTA